MTDAEKQFINELGLELKNEPQKENIIAEYRAHVYDICHENKQVTYDQLVRKLGTPRDIAKMWKQETGITPKKTQWLFILLNFAIFIGGSLLMVGYNVFEWTWLASLWHSLTEVPFIIMMIYLLFWGLLGYEMGKEFGHNGLALLRRTFAFAIIPNVLLMYFVIFKIFPHTWFGTMINVPFIVICIGLTALLYPICL